jgi:ssDNA-binding Zn-finger/Zn-ribbon topoisomerase 1
MNLKDAQKSHSKYDGRGPCPLCGGRMTVRLNRESKIKFYSCVRFPNCRGTRHIKGQDNTSSVPVGDPLRDWRRKGHKEMRYWMLRYHKTRKEAYQHLSMFMELLPSKTHFAMFTEDECKKAIEIFSKRGD